MKKRKPTPFAEHSGKFYVQVQAVMHPFIPFCDGLPITFFGKSKKPYLALDVAIEWLAKELTCYEDVKIQRILTVLEQVQKVFAEGGGTFQ